MLSFRIPGVNSFKRLTMTCACVSIKSDLRRWGSALIRKKRWLPGAATFVAAAALALCCVRHAGLLLVLGAGAALILSSYVWGYSARVLEGRLWAPLYNLRRRQYADVWNSLAVSQADAKQAAAGRREEGELQRSVVNPLENLQLVSIGAHDDVLEIGCGVGRIGLALAPHCRSWTGADVSANMLNCASERLRRLSNVRLVQLGGEGLRGFSANSFNVVYSTNVFAHLDEIDRWGYVEEAFRVLRPGGRIYIDNIDIESDAGWAMFANDAKRYQSSELPPYAPRFSTTAELSAYITRAGFKQVQSHHRPPLVIVTGIKDSLSQME
jgi:ubiquinone/menaquinone biosynthesis C-methylase UbiE